jgi:coproporphyrinogen III oxidase
VEVVEPGYRKWSCFEKAVNVSAVHGKLPEAMQKLFNVGKPIFLPAVEFSSASKKSMVPTVHANWRYFEMYDENGNVIQQWFGGGQDLTPYYLKKMQNIFIKPAK